MKKYTVVAVANPFSDNNPGMGSSTYMENGMAAPKMGAFVQTYETETAVLAVATLMLDNDMWEWLYFPETLGKNGAQTFTDVAIAAVFEGELTPEWP